MAQKRRLTVLAALCVLVSILILITIVLISKQSDKTVKDSQKQNTQVASSQPASSEAETDTQEPSQADTEDNTPVTYGTWDLSTLSTDNVPYGFHRENVDANNVPSELQWYKNKWGKFRVDFVQDTSKNIIYLTMDEGFANEQTSQILDILKEKNVKATFFCTSDFVNNCPDLVQRMLDEGHQIGTHSKTHPVMTKLTQEQQTEEIMDVVNIMKEKYNYQVRLFRFPEGAYSDEALGLVENLGLKSVFWSFAYGDYSSTQPDVQESLDLTLKCVHPGAIYLLHANSSTNLALLSDFIDGVREKGFEFGDKYPVE